MVGALNKLPIALSGLIFFPEERNAVNIGYVVSILIAFSAGLVYSYAQVVKRRNGNAVGDVMGDAVGDAVDTRRVSESASKEKISIIEMLNEYESKLGLKATYQELKPKAQYK